MSVLDYDKDLRWDHDVGTIAWHEMRFSRDRNLSEP